MTTPPGGFLLVRVDGRRLGLQLGQVLQVVQLGDVRPVPVTDMAVRGLVSVHGRMLPLVHLGALLEGKGCPAGAGGMGVVVTLGGRRFCLEVDDAEVLVREPVLPVPPGEALPWAVGVARYAEGLVPLLDLPALSSRLTEAAAT
jgi:purine-binding chemotaxis protein CheW